MNEEASRPALAAAEEPGPRHSHGPRMLELRTRYARTQSECAAALGVAQPVYSGMERGEYLVRRRDLTTLAVLYDLPLEEAFPGA